MRGLVRGFCGIVLFCNVCAAQSLRLDWGQNYATFELSGKTLNGHLHLDNEDLTEDFDFKADISTLKLDDVLSDSAPPAYFVFNCKEGQSGCVRTTSHTCQFKSVYSHPPCPAEFTSDATNAFIGCPDADAYQRCVSFLAAVRAAAGSAQRVAPIPRDEPALEQTRSTAQSGMKRRVLKS